MPASRFEPAAPDGVGGQAPGRGHRADHPTAARRDSASLRRSPHTPIAMHHDPDPRRAAVPGRPIRRH